jgi:hypothetical protein
MMIGMPDVLRMRMGRFWNAEIAVRIHMHVQPAELHGKQAQACCKPNWLCD